MQKQHLLRNVRSNLRLAASLKETEDWSHKLARAVRSPLLIFAFVLLCLLILSIACDRIFGGVNAGGDAPRAAMQGVEGSVSLINGNTTAHSAIEAAGDSKSDLSMLLAGGPEQPARGVNWLESVVTLAFRLTLAALLGAAVAFRPFRLFPLRQRNPYVVQTQILLAVVACALMIIVGDSAARAFGIFAAASLVRFRTNIRDPKEITVLLTTLGVGLAAGVGRWELAIMFTLFVTLLLQILEHYEYRQAFRSMELRVKTLDAEATDEAVRALFRKNRLSADIKALNKDGDGPLQSRLIYSVDINPKLNAERLAQEIYLADPINIAGIEWHRKKMRSPAYGG